MVEAVVSKPRPRTFKNQSLYRIQRISVQSIKSTDKVFRRCLFWSFWWYACHIEMEYTNRGYDILPCASSAYNAQLNVSAKNKEWLLQLIIPRNHPLSLRFESHQQNWDHWRDMAFATPPPRIRKNRQLSDCAVFNVTNGITSWDWSFQSLSNPFAPKLSKNISYCR